MMLRPLLEEVSFGEDTVPTESLCLLFLSVTYFLIFWLWA